LPGCSAPETTEIQCWPGPEATCFRSILG